MTQIGCNPCARVKRMLSEIAPSVPGLSIREIPFDSEEGALYAFRHSILFPPAVLADGRLVARGKIREDELRRALGAPPIPSA